MTDQILTCFQYSQDVDKNSLVIKDLKKLYFPDRFKTLFFDSEEVDMLKEKHEALLKIYNTKQKKQTV